MNLNLHTMTNLPGWLRYWYEVRVKGMFCVGSCVDNVPAALGSVVQKLDSARIVIFGIKSNGTRGIR